MVRFITLANSVHLPHLCRVYVDDYDLGPSQCGILDLNRFC